MAEKDQGEATKDLEQAMRALQSEADLKRTPDIGLRDTHQICPPELPVVVRNLAVSCRKNQAFALSVATI